MLVHERIVTEEQVELGLRAQLVRQMQSIAELPQETTYRYFDTVDALARYGGQSPVRLDSVPVRVGEPAAAAPLGTRRARPRARRRHTVPPSSRGRDQPLRVRRRAARDRRFAATQAVVARPARGRRATSRPRSCNSWSTASSVTRQVELLPIVDEVEEVRTPGSGPAAALDAPTVVGHDSWLVPAPDFLHRGRRFGAGRVRRRSRGGRAGAEGAARPAGGARGRRAAPSDSGLLAGVVPGGGHGRVGGRRAGDTEGRGAVGSQLRPTDTCARSPGGEVAQPSRAEGRPGGGGLHAPDRAEHVGDHAEMEAAYRAEQQAEAKATPSPAAGAMSRPTPIATPAVTIAVKPVDASRGPRGRHRPPYAQLRRRQAAARGRRRRCACDQARRDGQRREGQSGHRGACEGREDLVCRFGLGRLRRPCQTRARPSPGCGCALLNDHAACTPAWPPAPHGDTEPEEQAAHGAERHAPRRFATPCDLAATTPTAVLRRLTGVLGGRSIGDGIAHPGGVLPRRPAVLRDHVPRRVADRGVVCGGVMGARVDARVVGTGVDARVRRPRVDACVGNPRRGRRR